MRIGRIAVGCLSVILYIIMICVAVYIFQFVLVAFVLCFAAYMVWNLLSIAFKAVERSKTVDCAEDAVGKKEEVKQSKTVAYIEVEEKEKEVNRSESKKLSGYELERFMVECNAWVEHQEEMAQYKEYYGIKDEE